MAEPKEPVGPQRPRPKEGYPLPGIDVYVKALTNRLHISEGELQRLQDTSAGLGEWMPAIQLIEDDRPPVRAQIGSGRILLTSDMKLPEEITEKTPLRQIVQTDALCLAKLGIIQELAPPKIVRESKKRKKEIKKQIGELTSAQVGGGRVEKISFKEAITSLDPKKMPLALAVAGFALASCTGGPKPVEPSPTEAIATEVAPTLEPIPTETSEPSPTPTPTPTVEPSPTPEPLPRNFAEPQAEILEEFMARSENQGYSSIEEALEDAKNKPGYKGLISYGGLSSLEPGWYFGRRYLVVGVRDVSTSHLPGMSPDAKVKSVFYYHPSDPDTMLASIFGLYENGQWTLNFGYAESARAVYIISEQEYIWIEPSELGEWTESLVGKIVGMTNLLYFEEQGAWNNPAWEEIRGNAKVLQRLIEVPGSYVQKFTEDPASYLGNKVSAGGRTGGHTTGGFDNLMSQLDPEIDVGGLITTQIALP